MKSIASILISLLMVFSTVQAFTTPSLNTKVALLSKPISNSIVGTTSTSLNVFGSKKSKAAKEEEARKASIYWEGDWVCKDCGYIYNRGECAGMFFEEQGPGFRCPQCSGPRRRYAKKVGDVVGTTLDGGDAPILLFSFGGIIATIAFGIWAVNYL